MVILLLTAMTSVVVLGIVARYILLISIPWTEEVARYLMIWTAFIAFGVAYRRRELILVRVLIDRIPAKLYYFTSLFSDLLCGSFLVLIVIYGIKLCLANANQVSPAARVPISMVYAIIPLGCAMCLLFIIESVTDFFKEKKGAAESW
jgi:TRAP-type C4-dicarboxylate transport system permease small subunit